jgi:hypothetical protein
MKIASTAKRIFDRQRKKTFATKSAIADQRTRKQLGIHHTPLGGDYGLSEWS